MSQESSAHDTAGLVAWDPARLLNQAEQNEVRLSRGFLRCRPERWFPAFATHWLPLAHSLGAEVKVTEVKPYTALPRKIAAGWVCRVDDDHLAVCLDDQSLAHMLETVVPGGQGSAPSVVAEYVARRVLHSVLFSWSGADHATVKFEPELDWTAVKASGCVKLAVSMNGVPATLWFLLGRQLVDKLDGLWRRQVRSSSRSVEDQGTAAIEIAQLAVPPAMLVDYLRSGTVVDLEVPVGDQVTIRLGTKAWMSGRLWNCEGRFCVEMLSGTPSSATLPDGTTRLSVAIEYDSVAASLDSASIVELGQPGAYWDTGIALTDKMSLVINGEQVGEARLGTFEGRFAMTVV